MKRASFDRCLGVMGGVVLVVLAFGVPGGVEAGTMSDPVETRLPARHLPARAFRRQALHAARLELKHPVRGGDLSFEVSPPEDFETLLQTLREDIA